MTIENHRRAEAAPRLKEHLTPKQVALALGVSEASVKRWCDRGKIETFRTAGGHRRLPLSSVMQYLRRAKHGLVRPEVLGLPPATGTGERQISRVTDGMQAALEQGDGEQFRQLAFNLYLAGESCIDIFDRCIAEVFHRLGTRWEHGDIEIYQERRACEICSRLLHQLRLSLPPVPEDAPRAIGGTFRDDPYSLATAMAEIVLREDGWRAESYGTGLPAATLAAAVESERPRLFWLSASHMASREAFLEEYRLLSETARRLGVALAVGGQAIDAGLRERLGRATYCERLRDLVDFARAVRPETAPS